MKFSLIHHSRSLHREPTPHPRRAGAALTSRKRATELPEGALAWTAVSLHTRNRWYMNGSAGARRPPRKHFKTPLATKTI